MDRHQWVVSDPPHSEADLDEAAMLLGLSVADARMKVNFGAPEVWLAHADEEQASLAATALRAAGLSVSILPAQDLLIVPPPTSAQWFSFGDDEFVAYTEDGEVHLRYDALVVGAFCRPPADFASGDHASRSARDSFDPMRQRTDHLAGRARHEQVVEMLERRTNLDLYTPSGTGLRRISIAQDSVSFSGLGEAIRPRASDNMDLTLATFEQRFSNLVVDKRMVNVRPRQRLTVGGPVENQENRRLLSFGTVGLQELLASVSPELADITQYELASRLSYLMLSGDDLAQAADVPDPA
jgi:hypothetical protein